MINILFITILNVLITQNKSIFKSYEYMSFEIVDDKVVEISKGWQADNTSFIISKEKIDVTKSNSEKLSFDVKDSTIKTIENTPTLIITVTRNNVESFFKIIKNEETYLSITTDNLYEIYKIKQQ